MKCGVGKCGNCQINGVYVCQEGAGLFDEAAKNAQGGHIMKPRVAFFDFTSCEGCQLDAVNLTGEELLALVGAIDIVNFREVKTDRSDEYDIAFIEGSICREEEIERLKIIRERAKTLVALGACAVTGGVNCLKNRFPMDEAMKTVYGASASLYNTIPARPVNAVVPVIFTSAAAHPLRASF